MINYIFSISLNECYNNLTVCVPFNCRVVYFSVHRYEHGEFWPNLRESDYDYVGEGRGAGFNFNVPLNTIGLGNADYMAIFHQLLLPMAIEVSILINKIGVNYIALYIQVRG